ncbi:MAG TPA: hypothetical protein VFN61_07035 [Acidimicrobiales bacterium]|nr:hypothetical protein [Acidimicrobiales bacterium]
MKALLFFLVAGSMVLAGSGPAQHLPVGRTYESAPPVPAPGTCHIRGLLPDPRCTPGAANPAVTVSDLARTICHWGWTETVRPPERYTEPLKLRQMIAYGEHGSARFYEEDHLVPLELGGAPSDPRNLWPEPRSSANRKDEVENAARRAVCDGRLALVSAQEQIATDWVSLGRKLGVTAGRTNTGY